MNGESRGYVGKVDIYVARVTEDLDRVLFADFLGGSENDYGTRLVMDENDCRRDLVISMTSHSADFPTTTGAFQERKLNDSEIEKEDQPVVLKIRPTISAAFRPTIACATSSPYSNDARRARG